MSSILNAPAKSFGGVGQSLAQPAIEPLAAEAKTGVEAAFKAKKETAAASKAGTRNPKRRRRPELDLGGDAEAFPFILR